MTPQVLHDTLRIFGTSLSVAIGAVAVAVFGTLLWSESSASRALRAAVARRRYRAHDNRSILQITMTVRRCTSLPASASHVCN